VSFLICLTLHSYNAALRERNKPTAPADETTPSDTNTTVDDPDTKYVVEMPFTMPYSVDEFDDKTVTSFKKAVASVAGTVDQNVKIVFIGPAPPLRSSGIIVKTKILATNEDAVSALTKNLGSGDNLLLRLNRALEDERLQKSTGVIAPGTYKYTTTLHAVHSGIYKLSQKSPPEKVYRGVQNMVISNENFKMGSFVELGAQSFTRDRSVAENYSGAKSKESKASYVYEVQEGVVDRGADISPLSYYPHEKEKLYGSLAMMQVRASLDSMYPSNRSD